MSISPDNSKWGLVEMMEVGENSSHPKASELRAVGLGATGDYRAAAHAHPLKIILVR